MCISRLQTGLDATLHALADPPRRAISGGWRGSALQPESLTGRQAQPLLQAEYDGIHLLEESEMSNSGPKLEVQVTGQFDFTAEQVFDALMDPQRAGRFMFAAPGSVLIKAEIDPRVGGRYLFIEEREGRRIEHGGEYLHIERPRRLAFTLEVAKGSHVVDTVEILIERLARGCRVTVTHRMSAEFEKYAKQAQRGCSRILQGLAGVLGEAGTGE